jgi:predicted amidophosphoribosyltransferase
MNDANARAATETPPDSACCPSCGGPVGSNEKRCPHCGRPMGARGFFFYAFWAGLSLVVVALIACIFYMGFLLLNRML